MAVVVAATPLPSATAATPAQPYNGGLAFATLGSVVLVTPDGTGMWRVDTAWVDSWSPDGERLLVDSENDLFAVDPDGGRRTRLTSSPAYDGGTECSPDGNSIAFEGDDTIVTGTGYDLANGGPGNDTIDSGDGDRDLANGCMGTDTVRADPRLDPTLRWASSVSGARQRRARASGAHVDSASDRAGPWLVDGRRVGFRSSLYAPQWVEIESVSRPVRVRRGSRGKRSRSSGRARSGSERARRPPSSPARGARSSGPPPRRARGSRCRRSRPLPPSRRTG